MKEGAHNSAVVCVFIHVCSVFSSVFLVFQHMLPFILTMWHMYLAGAQLFRGVFISYFHVSQGTSTVLVECFITLSEEPNNLQ